MNSQEKKNQYRLISLQIRHEHQKCQNLGSPIIARECLRESKSLIGMARPDFSLYFANPAFINTFNLDPKNLNQNLANYITPEELLKIKDKLADSFGKPFVRLDIQISKRIYGFTAEIAYKDNGEIDHYLMSGRDITEKLAEDAKRKAYEKKLEASAMIDPLTGVYNRRYFEEQLTKFGQSGTINGLTIIMFDLDDLRKINKNGHDQGDKKLIELTNLLQRTIQATDVLARIGGDEFAIIFPNLTDEIDVQRLLYRLYDKLKEENVNASFGFATSSKNNSKEPKNFELTFKKADRMLIKMKKYKNQI